MKTRKIISLLLAAIMLMSLCAFAVAEAPPIPSPPTWTARTCPLWRTVCLPPPT